MGGAAATRSANASSITRSATGSQRATVRPCSARTDGRDVAVGDPFGGERGDGGQPSHGVARQRSAVGRAQPHHECRAGQANRRRPVPLPVRQHQVEGVEAPAPARRSVPAEARPDGAVEPAGRHGLATVPPPQVRSAALPGEQQRGRRGGRRPRPVRRPERTATGHVAEPTERVSPDRVNPLVVREVVDRPAGILTRTAEAEGAIAGSPRRRRPGGRGRRRDPDRRCAGRGAGAAGPSTGRGRPRGWPGARASSSPRGRPGAAPRSSRCSSSTSSPIRANSSSSVIVLLCPTGRRG